LSTRLKNKKERLQQILTDLSEKSAQKIPVIVEGKKDIDALRRIGICGPILTLKTGGKSFIEATDEIQNSGALEAILLLDFDRRGKQATAHLKENLEHQKIKPNLAFWLSLQKLLGRELQCIEGLPSYIATIEQKLGKL
jgi:5S rRNA maturation endonuclease (ribonuclease M5)